MRKWIARLLTAAMLLSLLCVSAKAAETAIRDKYDQTYTLSRPWLEKSSYDDGTMTVTAYHITPDTEITLPGDSSVTYLVFSILSVSDMGDVDECSKELPGGTTFAPGETCTTAHILTFLWRANGSPEPTVADNPFTDVKESDYFCKAALWAFEKELVSGNVFTPSAPCTRGQTMLYLYLLAGSPEAELSTFTDVPADSVYSRAISWAVTQGITTGKTETTFAPDEICTRGHIATFLYRAAEAGNGTAA